MTDWFLTRVFSSKTFPKQALSYMCLQYKPFQNIVRKVEIARKKHSTQFRELPTMFIKIDIVVCKLFQFGRVNKYIDSVRVNALTCF